MHRNTKLMARFSSFASHKRARICAALCFMAAFLFVWILVPAVVHASKVVVTVTGTVVTGTDVTGVFAGKGASLAGYSYKLVYNYDDTRGKPCGTTISCIENDGLNNNPVVTAVMTINGNSYTWGILQPSELDSFGERQIGTDSTFFGYWNDESYTGVPNSYGDGGARTEITHYGTPYNFSWESPLAFTLAANDYYLSDFWVYHYPDNTNPYYQRQQASGTLQPKTLTISGPEPEISLKNNGGGGTGADVARPARKPELGPRGDPGQLG